MLASASVGKENALFEPIHGSFPQAKGQGIANPLASILSAAMLLDYLELHQEAQAIEYAVQKSLDAMVVTQDLNAQKPYSTFEVGDYVASHIKHKVKTL